MTAYAVRVGASSRSQCRDSHDQLHLLVNRVRAEYEEMPGLRLTLAQAQRLFGLERARCEEVLRALLDAKVLVRTGDGRYGRPEA